MNDVTKIAKRFVEEEEELMNGLTSMVTFRGIATMDLKELEMLKATFKLMETANELMVEYARVMDDMNAKIDKLIERNEKNREA